MGNIKKIRRNVNDKKRANRIFTDRDEPRAVFHKKYDECKNGDGDEIRVLTYYGIGGIGKSTLLAELIKELKVKEQNPIYVFVDFKLKQECKSVLDAMKNTLQGEYGFNFPMFDLACYHYALKLGETADSPEIKSLISKSPVLEMIITAMSEIPSIGILFKLVTYTDKGIALIRNRLSKHSNDLVELEAMGPQELYDKLPFYFAMDLTDNTDNLDKPLVVFFDTYENLVNEMSDVGEPLIRDMWIRGEYGLIQNVSNTLWIIAGREQLKWERFDEDWGSVLNQHLLGELSEIDSSGFLRAAGIEDEALVRYIVEMTKGTPIYLDLCVDRYDAIVREGGVPVAADFGNNIYDLIERFVRYMGNEQKDIVYGLSCLGIWTDEIAEASISRFNYTLYGKIKEFSFISDDGEGNYTLHQTVKDVLFAGCPELIKKNTLSAALKYCEENMDLERDLYLYTVYGTAEKSNIKDFYKNSLQKRLIGFIKRGRVIYAENIFNSVWSCFKEDTEEYAYFLGQSPLFLGALGEKKKAIEAARKSWEATKNFHDENDEKVLIAHLKYGVELGQNNEIEEAVEVYESLVNRMEAIADISDETRFLILSTYATTLYRNLIYSRRYEKKHFKIRWEAVELEKKLYGDKAENVLKNLKILKDESDNMKQYDVSLELQQEIVNFQKSVCGEESKEYFDESGRLLLSMLKCEKKEEAEKLGLELLKNCEVAFGRDTDVMKRLIRIYRRVKGGEPKKVTVEYKQIEKTFDYSSFLEEMREVYPQTPLSRIVVTEWSYCDELKSDKEQYRRYSEELNEKRRAYENAVTELGEEAKETLAAMDELIAYLILGDFSNEAIKLFDEYIALQKATLGENNENVTETTRNFASYLMLKGNPRSADVMEELLERQKEVLGEDNVEIFFYLAQYLEICENCGLDEKFAAMAEKAIPLCENVWMRENKNPMLDNIIEDLLYKAFLYLTSMGDKEINASDRLIDKLLERRKERVDHYAVFDEKGAEIYYLFLAVISIRTGRTFDREIVWENIDTENPFVKKIMKFFEKKEGQN